MVLFSNQPAKLRFVLVFCPAVGTDKCKGATVGQQTEAALNEWHVQIRALGHGVMRSPVRREEMGWNGFMADVRRVTEYVRKCCIDTRQQKVCTYNPFAGQMGGIGWGDTVLIQYTHYPPARMHCACFIQLNGPQRVLEVIDRVLAHANLQLVAL